MGNTDREGARKRWGGQNQGGGRQYREGLRGGDLLKTEKGILDVVRYDLG